MHDMEIVSIDCRSCTWFCADGISSSFGVEGSDEDIRQLSVQSVSMMKDWNSSRYCISDVIWQIRRMSEGTV